MHFWIDKRSQPYYQHGRRRAPLPLFLPGPSTHSNNHAPTGGRRPRKHSATSLMVTPVHRFQAIESIREEVNNHQQRRVNGRSRSSDRRRRSRSSDRHHASNTTRTRGELEPPPDPRGGSSRDPSPNLTTTTNGDSPSTTNGDTGSVYLSVQGEDNGTSSHASPASPRYGYSVGEGSVVLLHRGRIQCIMWACFALPIILMATAKFYLDNNHNAGIEFVGLGIVVCLFLVLGCTVSFFRMKTRRYIVSRIAGSACNGDTESQSATASSHRILLLPSSSSSPRTYRPQRLTLRPVTTSRSQPNMNDVIAAADNRRNNTAVATTNQPPQTQVVVPVVVTNGSVSVNIPPSLLRRSHSTYSEQTLSSLSPSEGWSVIDGEIGGAPPPYHVAILLPAPNNNIEAPNNVDTQERSRETPPPSYEKAIG